MREIISLAFPSRKKKPSKQNYEKNWGHDNFCSFHFGIFWIRNETKKQLLQKELCGEKDQLKNHCQKSRLHSQNSDYSVLNSSRKIRNSTAITLYLISSLRCLLIPIYYLLKFVETKLYRNESTFISFGWGMEVVGLATELFIWISFSLPCHCGLRDCSGSFLRKTCSGPGILQSSPCMIAISLLKSIIDDQISEMLSLSCTAMELSTETVNLPRESHSQFSLLLGVRE